MEETRSVSMILKTLLLTKRGYDQLNLIIKVIKNHAEYNLPRGIVKTVILDKRESNEMVTCQVDI